MVHPTITQALILVGGFGTRLRPLTLTTPKPLLPFLSFTILGIQIEALRKSGVTKIVLGMHYKYENIIEKIKENSCDIEIIFSVERTPLGTAGPILLAKRHLKDGPFFVLNCDILCEFPFFLLENAFYSSQCVGVVLTKNVKNPENFGVILCEDDLVTKFVEKPKCFVSSKINAGIYVFSPSIFNFIENGRSSLEFDVFPRIVNVKMLRIAELESFWNDVGTVENYLLAQKNYINSKEDAAIECGLDKIVDIEKICDEEKIRDGEKIYDGGENKIESMKNKELGKTDDVRADVGIGTTIADLNVYLGKNVTFGKNCVFRNCTVFENTKIGNNVIIEDSIVGRECVLGDGVVIRNYSIVGDCCVLNVE